MPLIVTLLLPSAAACFGLIDPEDEDVGNYTASLLRTESCAVPLWEVQSHLLFLVHMAANNVTGPSWYVNFVCCRGISFSWNGSLEAWIYLVGQEKSVYFRLGEVWFIYYFSKFVSFLYISFLVCYEIHNFHSVLNVKS